MRTCVCHFFFRNFAGKIGENQNRVLKNWFKPTIINIIN